MMFRTDLPFGGESGIIGNSVALRKRGGRWIGFVLRFRARVVQNGAFWCSSVHLGSFCASANPVARGCVDGCTGLHPVAPTSVSSRTRFRLRLRGSTRVGPRSREREDTRNTRAFYYPPNRA